MSGKFRIGTSGWNYRHWRGAFYPEKLPVKKWFEFYSQSFDTVELNNTFYRLGEPSTYDGWREQAPAGFLYAVKCNRFLTHNLKLSHPNEALERFFTRASRLGKHLGPVLYQLPPKWKCNVERLREFLGRLPKQVLHVIEFREPSWLTEEVWQALADFGAALCIHDLLPNHPRKITGPATYLRFHGATGKYQGVYGAELLRPWSDWIRGQLAAGIDVYAYFNNDMFAAALEDARTLRQQVER